MICPTTPTTMNNEGDDGDYHVVFVDGNDGMRREKS